MTEGTSNNPNLVKCGEATQFGKPNGPDPKAAARKKKEAQHLSWSVESSIRYFARQTWQTGTTAPSMDYQAKQMLGRPLTGSEIIALTRLRQAMVGHPKFSQMAREDIDGKVIQKQIETKVTLAELIAKSYDQDYLDGKHDSDEDSGE